MTGFRLSADDLKTVYVSGDNASVGVVEEIVRRTGPVDVAILFCGAASVPAYFDGAPLTLTAVDAAQAAGVLGARAVVPVHCDGWSHYEMRGPALASAFADAGRGDVLVRLQPGETTRL